MRQEEIYARREVECFLTDAQYDRARGVNTTDAQVLTEHLVEAFGKIHELESETIPADCELSAAERSDGKGCILNRTCSVCYRAEAERQRDCGMSEKDRAEGQPCPVPMPDDSDETDCAACTLFALRRLADCSPDARSRPAVCGSGVDVCLACQLATAKETAAELEDGSGADKVAALEARLVALTAEHEERLDAAMRDVASARAHAVGIAPEVNTALAEELAEARARVDCGIPQSERETLPQPVCRALVKEGARQCAACTVVALFNNNRETAVALAAAKSEAWKLRAERDGRPVGPAPVRPRRLRAVPRPGEVSLFDLVGPAPAVTATADLVVPVTEDAPAHVRTAGRACGCQARGRHRSTCPKREAVSQ